MRVGVYGALGRMGQMILRALLAEGEAVRVAAAVVSGRCERAGQDAGTAAGLAPLGVSLSADAGAALAACDVIIDFSSGEATGRLVAQVLAAAGTQAGAGVRRPALVIGTTGLSPATRAQIDAAAQLVPIVVSANMSQGVNVLLGLVERAARALPGYDAEIMELHHRQKKDAPSGTALLLSMAVRAGRDQEGGGPGDEQIVTGRQGLCGPRTREELGVLALRGGDVVGEHTVFLLGTGERIEITHRATSREVFAHGAVRAARWAVGQEPGLYDMGHVLGF